MSCRRIRPLGTDTSELLEQIRNQAVAGTAVTHTVAALRS